jgi:hypothetical protein
MSHVDSSQKSKVNAGDQPVREREIEMKKDETENSVESHCSSAISDTPDLRGPAAVVLGSVLGGFKFYGPFPTIEAACEWCQTKTVAGVLGVNRDTVVLLEEPRSDDVLV